MKTKPPKYAVELEYYYQRKTDEWEATITWTEYRMGKQYGGAVVQELKSHPGCSSKRFMQICRESIAREMKIYWT